MKKFYIILITVILVCVVGSVCVSAWTPNYINNLVWSRSYNYDGIICSSTNTSYPYGYIELSRSNYRVDVYGVDTSNVSTRLGYFDLQHYNGSIVIGGGIDRRGFSVMYLGYDGTNYNVYVIRYDNVLNTYQYSNVGTSFRSIASDTYQFVSHSDGVTYYLGYISESKDGNYHSFYYGLAGVPSAPGVSAAGFSENGGGSPVGCLMPHVRGIINTYTGYLYGVNGSGVPGIYQIGYSGPLLYGGGSSFVNSSYYYYAVDPYSLSVVQCDFNIVNSVLIPNVNTAVPDFFSGGSIDFGTSSFPLNLCFTSGYLYVYFSGAKTVYRFSIELLPSENPGNFFDFGGTPYNVEVTVSGIEVSYDDTWLRDHYSRMDAQYAEDMSYFNQFVSDASDVGVYLTSDYSVDNFEYSGDLTFAELGDSFLSANVNTRVMVTLLIVFSGGALVAGLLF